MFLLTLDIVSLLMFSCSSKYLMTVPRGVLFFALKIVAVFAVSCFEREFEI